MPLSLSTSRQSSDNLSQKETRDRDAESVCSQMRQLIEADSIFRGRLALCGIQIESNDGRLVLRGRLPSYYLKQRLQQIALNLKGVKEVENLVEVTNG